jgi:hypothetical protein
LRPRAVLQVLGEGLGMSLAPRGAWTQKESKTDFANPVPRAMQKRFRSFRVE